LRFLAPRERFAQNWRTRAPETGRALPYEGKCSEECRVKSLVVFLLRTCWRLFMVATPLLGVWLASSLVALYGGPRELALAGGVLLFPVLPVLWEMRAARQWREKLAKRRNLGAPPKRRWTTLDRLVARTLVLNLSFLAALLVWFPKTAFTALATRGDWFLEQHEEPWANDLRKGLFAAANGLEWLHEYANPNPYKKQGDETPVPTGITPTLPPEPIARRWIPGADWRNKADAGTTTPVAVTAPDAGTAPEEEAVWEVGDTRWPLPNTVHPVVAAMSGADEASIEAVARHIASRESDPFQRVKALHDWVVTRLHYDKDSTVPSQRKPQDAESVFRNRMGVCEGYARLMVELGKHSGDRVVFLVGDVRDELGNLAPVGHAWNAAEVRGKWYLLDATWDDPVMKGGPTQDSYQTDYLFIPPNVAVLDHFPEEPRWQLLAAPLSRGEFLRQPFARPGLAREGLTLVSPERAVVEVGDALQVTLDNPRRLFVMVSLSPAGGGEATRCGVDDAARASFRCTVPGPGKYEAHILTNRERYGTYGSVATLAVVRP
jgi:transglutaminase-like putative cysteine protease